MAGLEGSALVQERSRAHFRHRDTRKSLKRRRNRTHTSDSQPGQDRGVATAGGADDGGRLAVAATDAWAGDWPEASFAAAELAALQAELAATRHAEAEARRVAAALRCELDAAHDAMAIAHAAHVDLLRRIQAASEGQEPSLEDGEVKAGLEGADCDRSEEQRFAVLY